jgi:hypothetical protein
MLDCLVCGAIGAMFGALAVILLAVLVAGNSERD